MWGSEGKEITGFIKSLSYSWPDESPWEIQKGYIVPKLIECEIGFQVIHDQPGALSFADYGDGGTEIPDETFFGINQTEGMNDYETQDDTGV